MAIELTLEKAHELLKRAVEEKGADYVYPEDEKWADGMCRYFRPDGAPLCIVGHVLHYLGVTRVTEGRGAAAALLGAGVTTVPTTHWALQEAQCCQDGGGTWGEALAAFEEAAGLS